MSIAKLFKSLHGAIDKSKFVLLSTKVGKKNFPTKKDFKEVVEYLQVDPNDIYFNPEGLTDAIVYFKGPIYFPLYQSNMMAMEFLQLKPRLYQTIEMFKKLTEEKNYEQIFSMMDKRLIIPMYIEMYSEIPDDQKYEIFVDLYIRSEYGFEMFSDEFLSDVFSHRFESKEWKKRIKEFKNKVKLNEVTIYHGYNPAYNPNDAYSWSLSKKTAEWFANRFNVKGKVAEKKVKVEEVIDFFNQRTEEEVIIKTNSIH